MSTFELFELFVQSGQKLDALWEFFVTIHIAIFGALFVFHKMKKHQMVISLLSYFFFTIINARAKRLEYEFFGSVINELKSRDLSSIDSLNHFVSDYSADDRIPIMIGVHIVSLAFILYLLVMAKQRAENTITPSATDTEKTPSS